MTLVHTLPEDKWRDFVLEYPSGNIFHTPEMFQVFSRAKGHLPKLWAATKEDRVLALFIPVQVTLMKGFLKCFTTRSVAYGSVLYASDAEGHKGLNLMLQTYTEEIDGAPLFTELRNLSNLQPVQPILHRHGFVYEDHLNYLIDLERPPEVVFEGIGRRTRKNIRRAVRQGDVVVEEVIERDQLTVCYNLLQQSYQTARVPLADLSLFEAAFNILYPKRMIRFTLARVGHNPVATSVELLYKDVIYGWFGGMDRAYGSYVPNELLMWDILRWGAENSYRMYDFGGAGKPDEDYPVRDFKAKFGGNLVCYGRNTCVHSQSLLWLSEMGYRLLRRWL